MSAPPMPGSAKIKHDWYQTESHVVITILLKNAPRDRVRVSFGSNSLSVSSAIPNSESEYSLELEPAHEINPSQSAYAVTPSKIEVKLKKVVGHRWENLERRSDLPSSDQIKPIPQSIIDASGPTNLNPFRKDWNRIESELKKEEAAEKPEGDEALKRLFENIYVHGTDDVKKAMNKSFSESAGTVLSTNWNDVSAQEVGIRPPDGAEYRKWDE